MANSCCCTQRNLLHVHCPIFGTVLGLHVHFPIFGTVLGLHVHYPVFGTVLTKFRFSRQIFITFPIPNFTEILPVGAALIHADRQIGAATLEIKHTTLDDVTQMPENHSMNIYLL
jgi:hypothetical protein